MSHHWTPRRALTRTQTGWLMHDGRRLIDRIKPVFLRHCRALQATDPRGVHLTYGPNGDIDFIATAVWTMFEVATMRTAPPREMRAVRSGSNRRHNTRWTTARFSTLYWQTESAETSRTPRNSQSSGAYEFGLLGDAK